MKKYLIILAFFLAPHFINAQTSVDEILGAYIPYNQELSRANQESMMYVMRHRCDSTRIIICDTALFRNDDYKSIFSIFEEEGRLIVKSSDYKGFAEYNPYEEILTICISGYHNNLEIITTWKKVETLNTSDIQYNDIKIYPNPSDGTIYLKSDLLNDFEYIVYNIQGQAVMKGININVSDNSQIDLTDITKGVYFIVIQGNNTYFREKIVIR